MDVNQLREEAKAQMGFTDEQASEIGNVSIEFVRNLRNSLAEE